MRGNLEWKVDVFNNGEYGAPKSENRHAHLSRDECKKAPRSARSMALTPFDVSAGGKCQNQTIHAAQRKLSLLVESVTREHGLRNELKCVGASEVPRKKIRTHWEKMHDAAGYTSLQVTSAASPCSSSKTYPPVPSSNAAITTRSKSLTKTTFFTVRQ